MKSKFLFILPLGLLFLSQSKIIYAADCLASATGDLRLGQTTITGTEAEGNHGGVATPTPFSMITGSSLVNCSNIIGGNNNATKSSDFSLDGSNVDISRSKTVSGLKYYKLINTSSYLANQHGWIRYRIGDNGTGIDVSQKELAQNVILLTDKPSQSATQGLRVSNLSFYFDVGVVQPQTIVGINIGKVHMIAKNSNTPSIVAEDTKSAYLTLTMQPLAENTCTISNNTITLPTLSAGSFKAVGAELGQTNFTIKVSCGPNGGGKMLGATIIDNNNYANMTHLLTNTGGSSDVAVAIYDASNKQPINLNTLFDFGILMSINNKTMAARNFYAKYQATDAKVKPGKLYSAMTISVQYK